MARSIGRWLRERRIKAGLTHLELCKRARVSRNTLSLVENGKGTPKIETAQRIAAVIDPGLSEAKLLEMLAKPEPSRRNQDEERLIRSLRKGDTQDCLRIIRKYAP